MKGKGRRFDTEHFVAACRASLADSDVLRALAATVADALQDREGLLEAFGSAPTLRVTQLVADERHRSHAEEDHRGDDRTRGRYDEAPP